MVACTRRIAAVSLGIQATSLHTERADHAAWCRPSPHALRSRIKPLARSRMTDSERLVQVGRVGRPHGTDGAFVVEQASEDEERWSIGATVLVDGEPARITLMRRVGGGRRAIRLDRPAPRGAELSVRLADLPAPDADSYYAFQLVGLAVVDDSGRQLGRVVEVHTSPANDNLELTDGTLVPLVEDAIEAIDLEAGRVVVAAGFLGLGA